MRELVAGRVLGEVGSADMNQRGPDLTIQVGSGLMLLKTPQAMVSCYHDATLERPIALSRVRSRTCIWRCAFRSANTVATADRNQALTLHTQHTTGEAFVPLQYSLRVSLGCVYLG